MRKLRRSAFSNGIFTFGASEDLASETSALGFGSAIVIFWMGLLVPAIPSHATPLGSGRGDFAEGGRGSLLQTVQSSDDLGKIIRRAVETGAIEAEQGRSQAIRDMFAREGLVIDGGIHAPPGEHRDDYSSLTCNESDRRGLWLFYHWLAHIWQEQNKSETAYELGKAVAEHEKYGDSVYDYDRPPTRPFLDYRYEQQAAILTDYVILKRCGDPDGLLPQYESVVNQVLG